MKSDSPRLILSLHIPKCAGITLSHFLRKIFGTENVLFFYNNSFFEKKVTSESGMEDLIHDAPPVFYRLKKSVFQSHPGLAIVRVLSKFRYNPPFELTTIPKGARRVIHGHFRVHPGLAPRVDLTVILREPLERVLSLYRYLQSENDAGGSLPRWFDPTHSIDQFVLLPQNLETYSRYLNGIDLQEFRYIGVTEDIAGFCRLFDPEGRVPADHRNPSPKFHLDVQEATIEQFKRKNSSDYEIYHQALNLIQERAGQRVIN